MAVMLENEVMMESFYEEMKDVLNLYADSKHSMIIGNDELSLLAIKEYESVHNCIVILRKSSSNGYWYVKEITHI